MTKNKCDRFVGCQSEIAVIEAAYERATAAVLRDTVGIETAPYTEPNSMI